MELQLECDVKLTLGRLEIFIAKHLCSNVHDPLINISTMETVLQYCVAFLKRPPCSNGRIESLSTSHRVLNILFIFHRLTSK